MGGGLMQLVAYGAQDIYLTGSAQITFFKIIYRRHTNFSVEPIPQTFTGNSDFGRTVTCTINRNGDLITNMYTMIKLREVKTNNDKWGYVRKLGLAIVQHYKIEIGGSKIDEQYGDWLNIWWELSHKVGQERGYSRMIGDVPELTTIDSFDKPEYIMYVPLQFWFNRHNGLALPLIALQYHDVRVTIDFRPAAQCINKSASATSDPSIGMVESSLIIDYVYLDSEERKRFAQASHEYLIEQLQFTGSESLVAKQGTWRLNFNHPCKFIVWAPHLEKYNTPTDYVVYGSDWEVAREKFAKHLWLSTRNGLSLVDNQWRLPYDGASSEEVISPAGVSENLNVTAQLVFPNGIEAIADYVVVTADNVVLLENNVSMQQLSQEIDTLVTTHTTVNTPNMSAYLNSVGVTIQDHFNYGNYIDGTNNPVYASKLQLNGSDRFQERDGYYFNYVQPFQHFSNTPADGINVYSFALKPEDHQPSGTCNFSRIDNAMLSVRLGLDNHDYVSAPNASSYKDLYIGQNSNSLLNIYALNYNVLRIMSGMAGAAYSN
jgi:hypothetical protein